VKGGGAWYRADNGEGKGGGKRKEGGGGGRENISGWGTGEGKERGVTENVWGRGGKDKWQIDDCIYFLVPESRDCPQPCLYLEDSGLEAAQESPARR